MPSQYPITAIDETAAAPRPLRLLLIEDNDDDALLLERHLRRSGFAVTMHRVETASHMLEALSEPWDCILADYNLPQFSAPEALQLLKNSAQDVPFIMMSGAVSEETAVAAMRAGAHDYVSKQNLARLAPAIERELAEAVSRRHKRAAEQALRSSEERFHRLVEATPLALLICDLDGRVTYANSGVERLLDISLAAVESGELWLEHLLGSAFTELIEELAAEDARKSHILARHLHAHALGRPGETREVSCCHRHGHSIPVLLGEAVLNPEAEPFARQLAIFLVDLSEQKRSEELMRRTEKLAATGRLAASIAHEINNPLEAITNCIYLISKSELPEMARTFVDLAQNELKRVTHITTQTLRFYRQSTKPVQTDVSELLDSVLGLYETRLRDHNITVVRDYANAPSFLALDGEIRQVLANIVGNAIDAIVAKNDTSLRLLVLRARARFLWCRSHRVLSVVIHDRGTGMSVETLRRMFEPFFSTKGITGTGLGLWVSQEIMAKHNGLIQVRTRQHGVTGTTFRLCFPLDGQPNDMPIEANLPTLT